MGVWMSVCVRICVCKSMCYVGIISWVKSTFVWGWNTSMKKYESTYMSKVVYVCWKTYNYCSVIENPSRNFWLRKIEIIFNGAKKSFILLILPKKGINGEKMKLFSLPSKNQSIFVILTSGKPIYSNFNSISIFMGYLILSNNISRR